MFQRQTEFIPKGGIPTGDKQPVVRGFIQAVDRNRPERVLTAAKQAQHIRVVECRPGLHGKHAG